MASTSDFCHREKEKIPRKTETISIKFIIGGLPAMMSASEGEGGRGKADVVREVE